MGIILKLTFEEEIHCIQQARNRVTVGFCGHCHETLEVSDKINPLTPNDPHRGRTPPLTSKRCILYIYSTNIGTEYYKHGIYYLFFSFKMQFVS